MCIFGVMPELRSNEKEEKMTLESISEVTTSIKRGGKEEGIRG